jgi:hypothetical protein
VDGVSVHQAVFEQGHDGACVVFAHLADVLEHERQGLEHAVLDVHVGGSVLVTTFMRAGSTVKGPHVSATMTMATVVNTRF